MLKQSYFVKMTSRLGTGERAMLVLAETGQKVFFNLEDKEAQEVVLDAETASQLMADGYDVVAKDAPKKPAKAEKE